MRHIPKYPNILNYTKTPSKTKLKKIGPLLYKFHLHNYIQ